MWTCWLLWRRFFREMALPSEWPWNRQKPAGSDPQWPLGACRTFFWWRFFFRREKIFLPARVRIDLLHAAPELKWVWHPCPSLKLVVVVVFEPQAKKLSSKRCLLLATFSGFFGGCSTEYYYIPMKSGTISRRARRRTIGILAIKRKYLRRWHFLLWKQYYGTRLSVPREASRNIWCSVYYWEHVIKIQANDEFLEKLW